MVRWALLHRKGRFPSGLLRSSEASLPQRGCRRGSELLISAVGDKGFARALPSPLTSHEATTPREAERKAGNRKSDSLLDSKEASCDLGHIILEEGQPKRAKPLRGMGTPSGRKLPSAHLPQSWKSRVLSHPLQGSTACPLLESVARGTSAGGWSSSGPS